MYKYCCLEFDNWIFSKIYIESILRISPLWAPATARSTTKEELGRTLLRVAASVPKIHWWLQDLLMQTLTYLQFVDRTQGNTVRLVICDVYRKCKYYKRWIAIQMFVVFIPIVYVPMGTSASNTATITFSFTDTGSRKYDMKISQIECGASTA